MTVRTAIQRITQATFIDYSDARVPFSTVQVTDATGSSVTLFFGLGKAQAVADAINAAIGAEVPA